MLTTTLELLGKYPGCYGCRHKLLVDDVTNKRSFPENNPIRLADILELCGLDDALQALSCTVEDCDQVAKKIALDVAEAALPFWRLTFPHDSSPAYLLQIARKFVSQDATLDELSEAHKKACISLYKGDIDFRETCNQCTTSQLREIYANRFSKALHLVKAYLSFVDVLLHDEDHDECHDLMFAIGFIFCVKSCDPAFESRVKEIFLAHVQ